MLLIGKKMSRLKEAALEFRRHQSDYEFGKLLGYPDCCNAFYSRRAPAALRPGNDFRAELLRLHDGLAGRGRGHDHRLV